ncbi:MAG: hypothetical protein V3R53_04095 [Gammaproteobacteria bacterium]
MFRKSAGSLLLSLFARVVFTGYKIGQLEKYIKAFEVEAFNQEPETARWVRTRGDTPFKRTILR